MTKHYIRYIISLMTIAGVGLLGLQGYLLYSNYMNQKLEVERDVQRLIVEVPDALARLKTQTGIQRGLKVIMGDSSKQNAMQIDSILNSIKAANHLNVNAEMRINTTNDLNIQTEDKTDTIRKQKQIRKVIAFQSNDSLQININDSISTWEQSPQIMLQGIMSEVIVELFAKTGAELRQQVDSAILDSIIRANLNSKGIFQEYAFEVYNSKAKSDTIGHIPISYFKTTTPLFPKALIPNPLELSLGVSDIDFVVFKRMTGVLVLSTIVFVLFFFGTYNIISNIIKQKKISEIRRDFINNMTHEFKTPIATIGLAAKALVDERVHTDFEKVKRYAHLIEDENSRMLRQVESILRLAVTEQNQLELLPESLSSTDILNRMQYNIYNRFSPECFQIQIQEESEILFTGDPLHIENCILNLVENAIKYKRQDIVDIQIVSEQIDNSWVCSVIDNGIGISKEAQKRVFDTFYRVPTGNRHDVKGFGLGLAYVKNIVIKMGGRIELESTLGKGSCFRLILPAQKP